RSNGPHDEDCEREQRASAAPDPQATRPPETRRFARLKLERGKAVLNVWSFFSRFAPRGFKFRREAFPLKRRRLQASSILSSCSVLRPGAEGQPEGRPHDQLR